MFTHTLATAFRFLCTLYIAGTANVAVDTGGSIGLTIQAGPEISSALIHAATQYLSNYGKDRHGGPAITVAIGASSECVRLISSSEVNALGSPDAFIIRSGKDISGNPLFACMGKTARATGYAFFELLQHLGFAFLHPLRPVQPELLPQPLPTLNVVETPRWELRGTHYHTQHPLELTNLLNGYDSYGNRDKRASWEVAFPMWEAFLHWMLAQKQNYIEWMILTDRRVPIYDSGVGDHSFELSAERQARLQLLVQAAHSLGIEVGADVPLTLNQQHAMNLLPKPTGVWQRDVIEVKRRIHWLLACGFDHLGTELGTTEFTQGLDAQYLVKILNVTKNVLGPTRQLFVKNHCSTKQRAEGFPDPRAGHVGTDLNFNYLSYYADPDIVSMPHTVQIYSLQDPAPTYGNADFEDLRNWTQFLLQSGRPVVFYPETAYWVNYDISVPLFLAPVYTKSRVDDANDLDTMVGPRPVFGQLNFESGWEWGYWLANAAQASVAWQKTSSIKVVFTRLFRFVQSKLRDQLVDLLCDFAEAQHRLLINSGLQGLPPAPGLDGASTTGIAYIQGSEGLSDFTGFLGRYLGRGTPQPDRLRFSDLWADPPTTSLQILGILTGDSNEVAEALGHGHGIAFFRRRWYREHLRPLLSEMNETFNSLAQRFQTIEPTIAGFSDSVRDLAVSARLLSLRCGQVFALYDYAADCVIHSGKSLNNNIVGWCRSRLAAARGALKAALELVPEQESRYGLNRFGIDQGLISQWRAPVPTAYSYGYLWAVHRLFYWQRDQAIVEQHIYNPCFASINDPIELGLQGGGGKISHYARDALWTILSNRFWHVGLAECLGVPDKEPIPLGIVVDEIGTPSEYV